MHQDLNVVVLQEFSDKATSVGGSIVLQKPPLTSGVTLWASRRHLVQESLQDCGIAGGVNAKALSNEFMMDETFTVKEHHEHGF